MKINIMAEKFGYVTQVIGPVVDVIFEKDADAPSGDAVYYTVQTVKIGGDATNL